MCIKNIIYVLWKNSLVFKRFYKSISIGKGSGINQYIGVLKSNKRYAGSKIFYAVMAVKITVCMFSFDEDLNHED